MRERTLLSSVILLFATAVMLSSCAGKGIGGREEKKVLATLDQLAKAYKEKDIEKVMALFSESGSTMAVTSDGLKLSGPAEIREAYERDFASFDEIKSVAYTDVRISGSEEVAWLVAEGYGTTTQDGSTLDFSGVLSAVLKKIKGEWRFVQTHWSFPVGGPAQGLNLLGLRDVVVEVTGGLLLSQESLIRARGYGEMHRAEEANAEAVKKLTALLGRSDARDTLHDLLEVNEEILELGRSNEDSKALKRMEGKQAEVLTALKEALFLPGPNGRRAQAALDTLMPLIAQHVKEVKREAMEALEPEISTQEKILLSELVLTDANKALRSLLTVCEEILTLSLKHQNDEAAKLAETRGEEAADQLRVAINMLK